jgi:hypothetical protein
MSDSTEDSIKKALTGLELISKKMKEIKDTLKEIQVIANSFSKNR